MQPFDHAWNLLKGYTPMAHGAGTLMPQESDADFGQPHDPYGTGEDMFDTPEMKRRIAELVRGDAQFTTGATDESPEDPVVPTNLSTADKFNMPTDYFTHNE